MKYSLVLLCLFSVFARADCVELSWDAVKKNINGDQIIVDSYNVYAGDTNETLLIHNDIYITALTYSICDVSRSEPRFYGVTAMLSGVESQKSIIGPISPSQIIPGLPTIRVRFILEQDMAVN